MAKKTKTTENIESLNVRYEEIASTCRTLAHDYELFYDGTENPRFLDKRQRALLQALVTLIEGR